MKKQQNHTNCNHQPTGLLSRSFNLAAQIKTLSAFVLLLMGLVSSPAVFAVNSFNLDSNNFQFNGFATFAASQPLSDETSINDNEQKETGDNDLDLRNHNVLGLRLTADLQEDLSLTAQMVSRGYNDYEVDFDWIYAEYKILPDFYIAAGRIRTPLFMYSEYLDVGYAYQWIQAPTEIYNVVDYPFQSMESVRLRYNLNVNNWDTEFLLWYGGSTDPLRTNGIDAELILRNAWGAAFDASWQWFTIRSVYFTGDTTADLKSISRLAPFFTQLEQLDSATPQYELSDGILWEDDKGEYLSLGLAFNFEYIFINTEFTRATVKDAFVIPEVYAGYFMLGWQITPQWSISYTYGHDKNKVNEDPWKAIKNAQSTDPSLNDQLRLFAADVEKAGREFQDAENQSDKINLRFDFHTHATVKLELWQERQENPLQKDKPQGIRLGLDMMF